MEIDRSKISKLCELTDNEFAELIKKSMMSAGCNENQARSAANVAPMIKKKLCNASKRDIDRIVSFIGEHQANEILSMVKDDDKK